MSVGFDATITTENQLQDIKNSISSNYDNYYIIELNSVNKTNKNKPIGYIRINWLDSYNEFALLRFGLGEERRKGYAKNSLQLFINKLFSQNCHRIEAEVYSHNLRSYYLLSQIGFKREGIKRQAHKDEDENYLDIYTMGLLKKDLI